MTGKQLLVATFKHIKKPYQILIIPLTFWSGIEQGFFGADFTAVSKKNKSWSRNKKRKTIDNSNVKVESCHNIFSLSGNACAV